MKQDHLLTEGNVFHALLAFSVPFLIANLIQALYGAVDLMVVGWYCSPKSVAAVSTGTQVTQIITNLVSGLTMGGTILVGKYTGMRDEEQTRRTIGTTLSVFLCRGSRAYVSDADFYRSDTGSFTDSGRIGRTGKTICYNLLLRHLFYLRL